MFAVLMVVQWVAGIGAAIVAFAANLVGTPKPGSHSCLGGDLSGRHHHCFAGRFSAFSTGTALTRHVIAIAQMLYSALLIHLTGGRIETHFMCSVRWHFWRFTAIGGCS